MNNIEPILKSAVYGVHVAHPYIPFEELESEAWVIVAESLETYREERGMKLSSYIYDMINMRLRTWIRLYWKKHEDMHGLRVFMKDMSYLSQEGHESRCNARMDLSTLLDSCTGRERDVILAMLDGLSQSETADKLGISRQRVSQILGVIRSHND